MAEYPSEEGSGRLRVRGRDADVIDERVHNAQRAFCGADGLTTPRVALSTGESYAMSKAPRPHRIGNGSMRIFVRVSPGVPATKVGGRYGDSEVLIVRVAARAVDGRANAATVSALADALGVPRSRVRIVTGLRARIKVVEVESVNPDVVTTLLWRVRLWCLFGQPRKGVETSQPPT